MLDQSKEVKRNMHKGELVRWVSKDTRLRQEDVQDVLDTTLTTIRNVLKEGRDVVIPGFGRFYVRKQKGGTVRHVKTGEPIKYKARRVVAFHVGDTLKRTVQGKQ
jgi:DNA-binding protein HU-beta